jgi:hypothetical protein
MLDVGNLQPGNYTVGIADPSILAMAGAPSPNGTTLPNNPRAVPGAAPGAAAPNQNVAPGNANPGIVPRQPGAGAVQPNAAPRPAGNVRPAPGAAVPQSNIRPSSTGATFIPRTVLAQVADTGASDPSAAASSANPNAGAATGGPITPGSPGSSANPVPGTDPTGPTAGEGLQRVDTPSGNTTNAAINNGTPNTGTGATIQIGTLTVDQSGTGRLQQTVESVRVQDVIGQAIAIYGQSIPANATPPSNLDPTGEPRNVRQPATSAAGVAAQGGRSATNRGAITAGAGTNMPVAAGLIRALSDRPTGTTGATNGAAATGTTAQPALPASQTPAAPQNNIAPATPNP